METNRPLDPRTRPAAPRAPAGASGGDPQPGPYRGGGASADSGQSPYGDWHEQGMGDRAVDVVQNAGRQIHTSETKPFSMTSEFLVWLVTVIAVVIAGAMVGSGDHGDVMRANLVWILVTAVSVAYIISRGISKAGTGYRARNDDGYRGGGYRRG